ncbi:MAG: cellulase family glycosylhydrolase [Bacteroidetes bacterium]|nr:cellulase family glycosylhydrolase [Bacteroidota bacterium]
MRQNLGSGTNVSLLEHTWTLPEELLNTDLTPKLNQIAQQGFKTVRLPVAFDLFVYPNSSTLQPQLLTKLKEIYYVCYNLKLHLIITYHYGIFNDNSLYNSEINHVSWIWKQVQQEFKGHGYDYLFFELYNEPTMGAYRWKLTAEKLISYIRGEDVNRVYIVGGSDYNGLNALIEMGKLNDEKTIYCFHFYEPYIFTHQGADWTKDKTYMTGFPYPYKRRKMPPMSKEALGTSVEKDYNKYYYEGTRQYLNDRMNQIASFCEKNNMLVICTEAGVIDVADKDSRANYLKDITLSAYQYKIPVILWDYDQRFSIHTDSTKIFPSLNKWIKKWR